MPTKGTLIAEGACTVHIGEESIGRETWQFSKLAHGGLLFTSRAERAQPQPATWNFTFEISQHWAPLLFSIRLDTAGKTTTSEQRAAGTQWLARVEPRGEPAHDWALDFSGKHEIGFLSPVFATITLVRLNLQVGQSRECDAVLIDGTTLEPRAVKQHYTCLGEEKVEVPAGKFSAWHYTVRTEPAKVAVPTENVESPTASGDTETATAPSETHFWADRYGVILLYQAADGSAIKLARYRRIGRR